MQIIWKSCVTLNYDFCNNATFKKDETLTSHGKKTTKKKKKKQQKKHCHMRFLCHMINLAQYYYSVLITYMH